MKQIIILSAATVMALSAIIVTESVLAVDGYMIVCIKKSGQLRVIPEGDICNKTETGPTAIALWPVVPPGPKTLTVNCDSGETIMAALDAAGKGDTINIHGTCKEAITLYPRHNEVWLSGQGGATIDAGGQDAVSLKGAQRVRITGLTVRNGHDGLRANYNATVFVENCTFSEHSRNGFEILANSSASIVSSTASRNGGNGIRVWGSSFAWLENNTVKDNNQNGVQVMSNASVNFVGNAIESNVYAGIDVSGNSFAGLWGGNIVKANADSSGWRGGIGIFHNSQVTIGFSNVADIITENRGPGISAANSSSIFLNKGIISNNLIPGLEPKPLGGRGHGIRLNFDSFFQAELDVQISNNDGYGIWCADEESGASVSGIMISGNSLGDTNCY